MINFLHVWKMWKSDSLEFCQIPHRFNSLFALLNNLSNFIEMKNKNIDIGIWNTLCIKIHVQVHYRIHIKLNLHIELSCIIDVWKKPLLPKNYNVHVGEYGLLDPPFQRERERETEWCYHVLHQCLPADPSS